MSFKISQYTTVCYKFLCLMSTEASLKTFSPTHRKQLILKLNWITVITQFLKEKRHTGITEPKTSWLAWTQSHTQRNWWPKSTWQQVHGSPWWTTWRNLCVYWALLIFNTISQDSHLYKHIRSATASHPPTYMCHVSVKHVLNLSLSPSPLLAF